MDEEEEEEPQTPAVVQVLFISTSPSPQSSLVPDLATGARDH